MDLNAATENKFTIKQADVTVSNKVATRQQRPCQHYIDISFNKDADISFFSYITLQNFYTHAITVKQFITPAGSSNVKEEMKDDKNWVSILKNYTLMQNAHYENDAQNWHIVGVELVSALLLKILIILTVMFFGLQFNTRFERRNLKHLRIYLKQPSPSWNDFSLRSITVFTKRIDYNSQPTGGSLTSSTRLNSAGSSTSTAKNGGGAGFDAFRSKLRTNLQGVKNTTKNSGAAAQGEGEVDDAMNNFNTAKMVGSAVHHYTEEVRRLDLCPGFI